jgi:DNA polymerase-3 subunit gamma/tau
MVGQEHVKEVLRGALRSERLAQAYLFSGPRGVGKTTSARLIAQAVNCSHDPRPCGVCAGCRLVREGRHPDVLEIDAASNNSVEDIRDLRERVLLAPIMGESRVIILDEAHMLSKSAFNALLKTLEEPPPHVVFVFATTEPERMPPTILSRTQHFRFRRLSETEIVEKLQRILLGLGRTAELPALQLIARLADGAMRDAESLLDRLLTLEGPLTLQQTEDALGLPPQEALFAVAQALDTGDVRQALEQAQRLYNQGFAARTLAQGLLEALRAGLYGRLGLGSGPELNQPDERLVAAMTALDETLERLLKRSDAVSLELAVLSAYQALHRASPAPTVTTAAAPSSIPDFDPRPKKLEAPEKRASSLAEDKAIGPPSSPPGYSHSEYALRAPPPAAQSVADLALEWRRVMNALKMTIRGFVREAEPRFEEDRVVLLFPERASFHYQGAQRNLEDIQKAVRDVLGIQQVELRLGEKKKLAAEPAARPLSPPDAAGQQEASRRAEPEPALLPDPTPPPQQLGQALLPHSPTSSDAPLDPAPADPPWVGLEPAPTRSTEADDPPEPAPWNPEAQSFGQSPLDEASDGTETRPINGAGLLEDPRFQKLVKLFGGRLRKFYPDAPRQTALEASSSDAKEELD